MTTEEKQDGAPTGDATDPEQQALDLCATCAHTKAAHPDDADCTTTWRFDDIDHACKCREYWPTKHIREDGQNVRGREIALSGAMEVICNSRMPSEFWDSLKAGKYVRISVMASVEGKGFKLKRDNGYVVGVTETRKLKAEHVLFDFDTDSDTDGDS